MTKEDQVEVPLLLTLKEVNLLLACIGKRPLEDVIELFIKIQTQGQAVVRAAEQARGTARVD